MFWFYLVMREMGSNAVYYFIFKLFRCKSTGRNIISTANPQKQEYVQLIYIIIIVHIMFIIVIGFV